MRVQWKDVLSESVLEKEGKSEQEKLKATREASPQPAAKGGGGRQGAAALITPAKPMHPVPTSQLLPMWLWELALSWAAPEAM